MTSRRDVIRTGLAGAALPLAPLAQARAATGSDPVIHRAIYDERFQAGRDFALEAARRGWHAVAIRGDVTDVWFHHLDLRWKQGPAAIAGVTSHSSLFVLERLAWDAGLRVTARANLKDEPLVSWIISPARRGRTSVSGAA